MPDHQTRKSIDYQAAAEQLVAVLAAVARRELENQKSKIETPSPRPIAAATLARLVFGFELCRDWSHETRRRRIRDTAVVARQLLARDQATAQIAADGRGYWLTGSPSELAAYAARRKRHGLAHLAAAAHQVKPTILPAAGQLHLDPQHSAPSTQHPHGSSPMAHGPSPTPAAGQTSFFSGDPSDAPTAYDLTARIPRPQYRH
jgi:hypothetical protein